MNEEIIKFVVQTLQFTVYVYQLIGPISFCFSVISS